ncbi:MAG: hypothetical protein NW218_06405 [Saprospiraceae bacterium]|nr:hypothetical protein [Saprospiraceae bacterium]
MLKRVLLSDITDHALLAQLLRHLLELLHHGPLQKPLRQISYETMVNEKTMVYLCQLPVEDLYAYNIGAADYHCVLERLLKVHPTIKLWQTDTGELFIEI